MIRLMHIFLQQTKKSITVSQQLVLGLQLLEATANSGSRLHPNSTSHFKEVPEVGQWCTGMNNHLRFKWPHRWTKASHLWGISTAMDLQSLPSLKAPCSQSITSPIPYPPGDKRSPPNPWSPSPPRGTFTRRPLAQPPCTLHILILINVMQVSPFWGIPSFSIPGFLLDLHNHMSFTPLVPSFCLQGECCLWRQDHTKPLGSK